jgi:hypothetical protein
MKNRLFLIIIAVFLSTALIFSFCFVLRSEALAASSDKPKPALKDKAPGAPLPDLDVTFIERQPMYFAYCVEYKWGEAPGMPGRPYVCPGTENERRWPNPGEMVTFTAHIVNKGDAACPTFGFSWQIDGAVVLTGELPALNPGETVTTTYAWPWAHGLVGERLTGTHTVGFTADPAGLVDETIKSNNNLTDRTDAVSFQIVITPQMVLAYNKPITDSLPRSAEDWFQKQVKAMNNALNAAIYPATPAGAVTQVRINRFVVRDTPIDGDRSHDGSWFVDADYRLFSAYYDRTTDIDWAWIHEMSHQMSLIDLYMSNVEFPFNHVLNHEGLRMNIGFAWPATNSIMFGGDTSPYTAPWVYDSHTAGGARSNFGYRNGFYGAYQFDIPLQNSLQLLDTAGQPAAGVQVSLYRKLNLPGVPADLDNTPEISGTTGTNGLLSLPNLPVNGGTTTPTGHTLHPNPFGMVDIVGEENRYLVKIVQGEHEEFQWLDITAFNLAYWQGNTNDYTYTIHTHLPVAGAPPAPLNLEGKVQGDSLTIYWTPGPASVVGYNVYRMGPPDYQYVKVSALQNWTNFLDFFNNYPQSSACFYVVTAVDALGRESGFSNPVWLPRLSNPVSVVVEKDRNVLVQDSSSNYNFPEISPSSHWLRTQPVTEFSAYGTQFFTLNPDDWMVVGFGGSGPTIQTALHLYNPHTEAGFTLGDRGAGQLNYPTGVAWWGSQGYSVQGTYSVDSDTLLLAHFDGSFNGAQGEVGTSSGVTFSVGKYGQAASFYGSDVLTYPSPGNVVANQGGIEFWTRPTWDGNDNLGHTFIEVNETWENRIKIAKDGANNLRFLIWDPSGKEYGVYCPIADWKAGDWHHVAAAWQEEWMTLAVDGVPCKSTTQGGMPVFQDETVYVGNSAIGNESAAGLIDELRISYLPRFGNTDQLRILVADAGGVNRVVALDGLGNLVASFGSTGGGNNQFNDPRGLTLDSVGNVIVVDRGNNRLQVLGFDGSHFTYKRTLTGGFNAPNNAASYLGWLIVADTGNNQIKVLDPSGNLAWTYTEPDDGMLVVCPFAAPQGVAVDQQGEIIIADTDNSRVVRIVQNVLPKNFTFLPLLRK